MGVIMYLQYSSSQVLEHPAPGSASIVNERYLPPMLLHVDITRGSTSEFPVNNVLKGLIVFGYYTSEEGATQELHYVAMPDGFKGSVPLSLVKSAYSSKAYY